jgi:rubredoxin
MPAEPSERRVVYQERKESGYCPRCGTKVGKRSKFIYCEDCRSFFREYTRENSKSVNKKRRKLYEERKDNNQCPRCGIKLGKRYKKTLCVKCLDKNK